MIRREILNRRYGIWNRIFNTDLWIHVMSDVILHANMTPLTVEDRLLIKTSQTENSWIVEKVIVILSFQRDSGNGVCYLISYEYCRLHQKAEL